MGRPRRSLPALLLAALVSPSLAAASDADEAMVFIRVFGDVQVEHTRPWKRQEGIPNTLVATGSGFVIAPSGLILTSHHVVHGETSAVRLEGEVAQLTTRVTRIEVIVGKGAERQVFEPFVAAADPDLDLAVLQVGASDLPYLPLGDSDAAEPGRPTRVLGFPFGTRVEVAKRPGPEVAPEVTITAGSLSATRTDDGGQTRFLQTDANVNPGSSGGPMVDEDGYAIGVVKMKIMAGRDASGPGFTVPIDLVKDFLEAHGLLQQLPTARLRPGVVQGLGWKAFGLELPDGLSDLSPARLRLDTLDSGGAVSARVERVATPWNVPSLEEVMLQGKTGFVPGPASSVRRVERGRPPRVFGSGAGSTPEGRKFRVEYALLDLGREKIVARFAGPPDDMAFNLGLIRRALEGLEATPLLTDEIRAPLRVAFEPVAYPGAAAGGVPLPAGWNPEPAVLSSVCGELPPPETGLAASPPGDFTVVFRALRWGSSAMAATQWARACEAPPGGTRYAHRSERLGVVVATLGAIVSRGEDVVLLEGEAPEAKLPFVREAFERWVHAVAEPPFPRGRPQP